MLNHALAMGGYGLYVWTAYSITLLVFGVNIAASLLERRQIKKIIQRYLNPDES